MTASRDTERLIRAFLDEGVTELPERVYHAVRSDIDRTHQRVVIGPWRTPIMNTFAKFAMAAAAVLVVALVGYNLLPGDPGTGGTPTVSPSPSPSPSPSVAVSPSPSPSQGDYEFFPDGSIEAGRHPLILAGKPLSVDMPSGWASHLGFRLYTPSGQAAFIFWTPAPINVYSDPCAHEPLDPPAGDTPAELVAAISSIPGTDLVSGPSDLTIDGHPAKHVSIRIRDDIDCPPGEFLLWYTEADGPSAGRYPDAVGDTINTWIIDVDGSIIWIDGSWSVNTTPALQAEMRQIVESIQFE
jgi:hypothetical protein